MQRMILGAAVAALTPLLLVPSAAAAQRDVTVVAKVAEPGHPQARVPFRDLDLTHAAGQRSLERRVRRAAETVCAPHLTGSALEYDFQQCRDLAWNDAEPQMARAVQRARDLALAGRSSIAPVAIAVVAR